MDYSYRDISKMIDHALLNPTLTPKDLENGCRLALAYDVASVCIMPFAVSGAAALLAGSDVAVGTTMSFPHGAHSLVAKVLEAEQAMRDGAVELDMVINISLAVAHRFDEIEQEVAAVATAVHKDGAILKVIFENCFLDEAAVIALCEVCGRAGADWINTSTGYGDGGATDDDIKLMRLHSPPEVQVKATGGIKTFKQLMAVRELGCTRVETTRTSSILEEARNALEMPPLKRSAGGLNGLSKSGS